MYTLTFHATGIVTVLAEGEDCCEAVDATLDGEWGEDVIERTHHEDKYGASCCARILLSSYNDDYDNDITSIRTVAEGDAA